MLEVRVTELLGCPYRSRHQPRTKRMKAGVRAHVIRQSFLKDLDFKTEVELRVPVDGGFTLLGHVDALYEEPGYAKIYELKTSGKIYHTYRLQVRTYAWLYKALKRIEPETYIILIDGEGVVREKHRIVTPGLKLVEKIIAARMRMIDEYMCEFGVPYEKVRLPNEFCRYCPFRRSCPIYKVAPKYFDKLDRFPRLSDSFSILRKVRLGGLF